jgi:ribosomal protein L6P/L9E
MKNSTNINLPPHFNFKLIKNKKNEIYNILIYNEKKILNLLINSNSIYININLNSIKFIYKNIKIENVFNLKKFTNFIKSWNYYFFKKIKFKGKGYKIKYLKKKKIMNFFFGKSHLTLFKYNHINVKKITKYKYLLKSNNLNKLSHLSKKIILIKPLNFYTSRGLRLSKQIVYKRKGKKNTYI